MAERMVTPVGDLKWVFITGRGKKDLNDNDRYVASVAFKNDSPELEKVSQLIETFWEENKPKGKNKYKSNGIKEEFDKEGKSTGYTLVNFWTGISFPDGSPKVIKTMNAKGAEVALGAKKIGNGSRGAVSGAMAIYQNGPNVGVTLYLNAIQLTKFVEFSSDAGFDVQEDEDGWTGEDLNEGGFEAQADEPARSSGDAPAGKPKVKL